MEYLQSDSSTGSEQPIAATALRITAFTEMMSSADFAPIGVELLDLFTARYDADIRFIGQQKSLATKGMPYTSCSQQKLNTLRNKIESTGLSGHSFRLCGTDETPLKAQFLPMLHMTCSGRVVDDVEYPFYHIDLAVAPSEATDMSFLSEVDRILRCLPIRAGFEGYSFAKPPAHGNSISRLPPAFLRFRTVTIADWLMPLEMLYHSKSAEFYLGKYTPGLPDVGWRTRVGGEFAARLGKRPDHPAVRVEQAGETKIVTAGDAPIWGDINAGDDISAYRAAAAYLAPAMASRHVRIKRAPSYDAHDAQRRELGEAYLDRFLGTATQGSTI
ncbi:hypothetical protein KUV51_02885 [Tateyamaria omphalii]|uniref:hypothetical protein n=1 Tax=Tateyamaria omphalii TaxID=299262 RepID=UPI001C991D56|nr:hypothetical protein [Tateyamaria omphalii]MBY5931935.1 hypothetical protein [Tateyamaria omphalii]